MALSGKGVTKDFDPTIRKSINTGYIIIPEDVDRGEFIEQCLRTERFSIFVEGGGGIMHNCYVTKSALRDLVFPLEGQTLGSAVVFFSEPFGGKAVITGVVSKNDETELNQEDIVVFKKTHDGNYALLSIDGKGQITIDVIGVSNSAKLSINVRSDDYSAAIDIHAKGKISLYSEGNTSITAIDGDIELVTNKHVNITSNRDVNIKARKVLINNASEPMVKGNELYDNIIKTNEVVKAIQDSLLTWVPTPNDGGSALKIKASQKLAGKSVGTFEKIKSKESFLD
jgi:hypothetical protein